MRVKKLLPLRVGVIVAALILGVSTLLFNKAQTSAVDLPVVYKYGSLWASETWTAGNVYVMSGVYVESGVTLTIQAGAIVKASSGATIQVNNGGTLNVQGASNSLAVFTSLSDDSYGGDSNGDGASVGSQGNYTFITSYSGGAVDVQYASFQYAAYGIYVSCPSSGTDYLNVTDSIFRSTLSVSGCEAGQGLVQRNHFETVSRYPIHASDVDPSTIPLSGLNQNTFDGSGQGTTMVLAGNSQLSAGTAWAVSNVGGLDTLYIAGPLTVYGNLTLDSGTVVKVDKSNTMKAFRVESPGNVSATGTANDRIIFTSIRDDNVNGDSAGDGLTSGAANDYGNVFEVISGTVDASFLDVRFAKNSLGSSCQSTGPDISLTDSNLEGAVWINGCDKDDVTMMRNSFDVTAQRPVSISNSDATILSLSGTNQNSFSGSGIEIAPEVYNSYILSGDTWTIGNSSGMSALVAGLAVSGALNLEPGVVVKAGNVYTITVYQGGAVTANGTSTDQIVFTSLQDDSVGGDSGGDGPTSGTPNSNYWAAVRNEGGAITMSHVVMRNASNSVTEYGNQSGPLGAISITDSTINSTLSVHDRDRLGLTLARNQFATTDRYPIEADDIDPSSIVLSGANKNAFSGEDRETTLSISQSTVADGSTWVIDASTNLDALVTNALTVNGDVEVQPGINFKVQQWITVASGGLFEATGTTSAPVVFTSINDDTAGGDSNGDGPSNGSIDNYTTSLKVMNGGQADIDNATFKFAGVALYNAGTLEVSNSYIGYVGTAMDITGGSTSQSSTSIWATDVEYASTGLYVGNYSTVKFRGSLTNISGQSLHACNWLESCRVDLAYTDWGSAAGPFPSSGALACGQAVVSPWKYNGVEYTGQAFNINNCDISTSPSQAMELKAQSFHVGLGSQQADCSQGIQDACDAAEAMIQCVEGAVLSLASTRYPILGFAIPTSHSASEEAEQYVSDALGAGSVYFNSLDENSTEARGLRLYDTASVFVDIGNAYNTCLN